MPRTAKLDNAIHFIISRCQPNELGAVKLNKILWYADVYQFEKCGKTITSDEYVKQQFGPVPKHVLVSIRELERTHKIATRELEYFGKRKREFWAIQEPDLTEFSAGEIAIIDQTIEWIKNEHTAQSISDHSRDLVWESAEIGEVIPIGAAIANRAGEITEEDVKWAFEELAKAS